MLDVVLFMALKTSLSLDLSFLVTSLGGLSVWVRGLKKP
jgi:hypothetical protein